MADCNDDDAQILREDPEILGVGFDTLDTFDPDVSMLIEFREERHTLTGRQEYDVHTAITRGLGNYLLTLGGAIAGRDCTLLSVVTDWAEIATGQRPLPSAGVYITTEVPYVTTSGLGPGRPSVVGVLPGGDRLTISEVGLFETEQLRVDVMCPDKELRAGVRRMLDRGLAPLTWMVGFRLALPRYHNAIATFLPLGAAFPDSHETAQQGLWPIQLRLRVHCNMYQPHELPLARPIVSGTIS